MADEKRLKFSVEGGNEVDSFMSRLKGSADSLARDLIASSRRYSTSGKEVLKDIEDQIKAIERRNKLDADFERKHVRVGVAAGLIDPEEGKRRLEGISIGASEDKLQTQLLRELIEVTKQTAREEIREDRKDVEKQILADKSLDDLGISGDEFEALKKTIQRQEIGDVTEEEAAERSRFARVGRSAQGAINAVSGAQNEFAAIAALFATIPFIGQALSGIASKGLNLGSKYDTAIGTNIGLVGGAFGDFRGFGSDLGGSIGYNVVDVENARAAAIRSRLSAAGSGEATRDILSLQRGLSLDQGLLLQTERLQRSETGGGTTKQIVQGLIGSLRSTGVSTGDDLSAVSEYLQILTELGQEQVMRLGRVDSGINTKMIAAIANLDETFQNPDVLKGVLSSVQAGLMQARTPQVEALQFAALSRLRPNANLFDLELIREAPFAEGNTEYLSEFLKTLRGTSGTDENFFRNIRSTLNLPSLNLAQTFGRAFI